MGERRRSAVVFGARNLGRAVIELLGAEGWAVTGVARSDATLEAVTATGALALRADVTDQESVTQVLEQAAAAHGGVDLVVNAASAYGGDRSGPFAAVPIAEAPRRGVRRLGGRAGTLGLLVPLRGGPVSGRSGDSGDGRPGHGRLLAAGGSRAGPVGCRCLRRQGDHAGGSARVARAAHPCRAADRRRRHRAVRRRPTCPANDAACGPP